MTKNLKQENSSKLLQKRSINLFQLSGLVVKKATIKKSKYRIYAETRVKLRNYDNTNSFAYVDLVGFGDIATQMSYLCLTNNTVFITCHLTNKIYITKQGEKKAKIFFMVDSVDRLTLAPIHSKNIDDEFEVVAELDPASFLKDDFERSKDGDIPT